MAPWSHQPGTHRVRRGTRPGGTSAGSASATSRPGTFVNMSSTQRHAHQPGFGKRVACAVAGCVLLVVGIALLVLPGPGLLLVLAGLLVLSHGFPAVERYVDPVQDRAMKAAEESVSSPVRIVFSVGTGLVLLAAGVVWGFNPTFPFGQLPL